MKYYIAVADSISELEAKVNHMITKEDYEPLGGVTIREDKGLFLDTKYIQGMVKD